MPLAEKVVAVPSAVVAASRSVVVAIFASAIWEATVRFQIRSYSASSSGFTCEATWPGVRKESPAGRIASCASCAFFTLRL